MSAVQWGNHGKTIELMGRQMGFNSTRYWIDSGESDVSTTCWAIQVINDAVFDALTDDATDLAAGVLSGITIPAGLTLFGDFTGIGVSSGVACCFSKS